MGIKMAVGVNGVKKGGDVGTIQNLLNTRYSDTPAFKTAADKVIPAEERASPTTLLKADSDCGPKTTKAIIAFQQAVVKMANPDGTVEPDRRTWKLLNGNVERPISITNRNVNGFLPHNQGSYKNVNLGASTTSIGAAGCMLTCLTMAATAIGRSTEHWPKELQPKDLTPALANTILKKANAYIGNGSGLYGEAAANALGMDFFKDRGATDPLTVDDMGIFDDHLAKRNPILVQVDYKNLTEGKTGKDSDGDHFVLVIEKNVGGTYTALDPSGGGYFHMKLDPKGNERYHQLKKGKKYGSLFGSKVETACTRESIKNTNKNQQDYIMIRYSLLRQL